MEEFKSVSTSAEGNSIACMRMWPCLRIEQAPFLCGIQLFIFNFMVHRLDQLPDSLHSLITLHFLLGIVFPRSSFVHMY